jgi:hypothetical protein
LSKKKKSSGKKSGRQKMLSLCLRENWICWLCGGEVPLDYIEGEPSAPSKDHVVPRSVFKKNYASYPVEFFRSNIKLAHRYCNSERQSREIDEIDPESYRQGLERAQRKWDSEN